MPISLSRQTAQKIVETVKDVCGHNINFINTKGIIFASTDPSRIGNYHEIGKKVVDTNETIEVSTDHNFYGTQKGVNIPFTYNREVIAAIGISGDPEEVRPFAVLAQKITSLILREQEIDSQNHTHQNWLNYIIRSLIEGNRPNFEQLSDFLEELKLSVEDSYRTILVRLNSRYHPSNLTMIETQIYNTFDRISAPLYTFHFPNEYVLLLPDTQYEKWSYVFRTLADNSAPLLSIGIGSSYSIWQQEKSYSDAKVAIAGLSDGQHYAVFDTLELEILLGCITETARADYLQKTIVSLEEEDLKLLQTYFDHNMSLKETSEALFLHKNTLQYQLNRIEKRTGHNPRLFQDAVKLYLALKLQ